MISLLKSIYRERQQHRRDQAIDNYFNQESGPAYDTLIRQMPDRALSSGQIRLIEEYAADTFGSITFARWLKVYTASRGEFLEGWMPMDYWCRIVCQTLNKGLQPLGRIKTMTQKFLNTDALPDLAYRVNGSWLLANGETTSPEKLQQSLFDAYPFIFLKIDHSGQGLGVQKVDRERFISLDFRQLRDFVLQAPIEQHDFFERISPGSVACLRVTTMKTSPSPAKAMQSGIRLGLQGSHFINYHCVVMPVWLEEGRLYDIGYRKTWEIIDRHPDTGVSFAGLIIPKFQEMKAFCERLHDQNPHFGIIAWDVVLDRHNQIKLMEWNTTSPVFEMSEASTGPHFVGLGLENLWKKKNPGK